MVSHIPSCPRHFTAQIRAAREHMVVYEISKQMVFATALGLRAV